MTAIAPPVAKILVDKLLGGILLVATSPIWLLISIAIVVEGLASPASRGGLFHTEVRVSAGRPFTLYKFRILKRAGEDEIKAGSKPKDVENTPHNLTRTGWILKKIGFDELPQLLCVITGRMTLVGPRPKPVREYQDELAFGHIFRAQLRAGMTGPSQAMKGTSGTAEDRVAAEFAYAELMQRGPWPRILAADFKTLMKTVLVVLRATGE